MRVVIAGAGSVGRSIARELLDKGLDRAAVEALVAWVATADDADLVRIQVRERAR